MKQFLALLTIFCGNLLGQSIIAPASTVNGVPASNLITICSVNPGSGTCAGGNLVTTYTTIAVSTTCSGTGGPLSGTGCSNPGNSDSAGNIVAFAAAGQYWCQYKASSTAIAYSIPCTAAGAGAGSVNGTNITPATVTVSGIYYPSTTITQTGTAGSTEYRYCVVATDASSNTKSVCQTTYAGNATLNGTNFNTVTVSSFSSTSPYILPVGSCNVYRTVSAGTPSSVGIIGTISSCSAGGSLADTGLTGDTTTPPADTSGNHIGATGNVIKYGTQTFGAGAGQIYPGYAIGENSYPTRVNGITGTSSWPMTTSYQGYGYAALDIGPALFTGPATVLNGNGKTVMGLNVGMATAFPDNLVNVMAMNGQLTSPTTYTGNQWQWYGLYHESDWWSSGTLHGSDGAFAASYNNGNGTCSNCIGGHFEAIGNFYGGTNTPTTNYNAGLECNSGVKANATHVTDYCLVVLSPQTGGTFTNGHTGLRINDQTSGGVLSPSSVFALQILPGPSNASSGQVDLGPNPVLFDSTGSGAVQLNAPTGTLSPATMRMNWPSLQGYISTSPCSTGGRVFLASDFTSANSAGLQAITGLSCAIPTLSAVVLSSSFSCELIYSQATNVASDQFGVSYTGGVTTFNAWANVATNTGAATPFTSGTATAIASNTPTAVVTFQPGNTGLNIAEIDGTIVGSGAGTLQLYVTNGTAADVIVVRAGSFCRFF